MSKHPTTGRIARRRLLVAVLFLLVGFEGLGCEKKSPAPIAAPGTPAAPSQLPAPDWTSVKGVGNFEAVGVACRLSRLVDAWHKGSTQRVVLSFSGGKVVDPSGKSASISEEDWKGVLDMIAKTPEGKTASRALPAGAMSYHDGLGKVPRRAYFLQTGPGQTLEFTFVKDLNDESAD